MPYQCRHHCINTTPPPATLTTGQFTTKPKSSSLLFGLINLCTQYTHTTYYMKVYYYFWFSQRDDKKVYSFVHVYCIYVLLTVLMFCHVSCRVDEDVMIWFGHVQQFSKFTDLHFLVSVNYFIRSIPRSDSCFISEKNAFLFLIMSIKVHGRAVVCCFCSFWVIIFLLLCMYTYMHPKNCYYNVMDIIA